jgi:3-keto-5-aminohexanoate cleavage enzyme
MSFPKAAMRSLVIMVAPNGARRTKFDHPALPISASELTVTAKTCRSAGAAAFHLHVRNAHGSHSLDEERYVAATQAILNETPDILVQVTTEAAGIFDVEQQAELLIALRPRFASLSIREICRSGSAKAREVLSQAGFAGIGLQYILYDNADIELLAEFRENGWLHTNSQPAVITVAGRYSAARDSRVQEIDAFHNHLAKHGLDEGRWMACAFGSGEIACLRRTIELGGHVRVGFENAITDQHGRPAKDNAERVALVASVARNVGRELAGPLEAKGIIA